MAQKMLSEDSKRIYSLQITDKIFIRLDSSENTCVTTLIKRTATKSQTMVLNDKTALVALHKAIACLLQLTGSEDDV